MVRRGLTPLEKDEGMSGNTEYKACTRPLWSSGPLTSWGPERLNFFHEVTQQVGIRSGSTIRTWISLKSRHWRDEHWTLSSAVDVAAATDTPALREKSQGSSQEGVGGWLVRLLWLSACQAKGQNVQRLFGAVRTGT